MKYKILLAGKNNTIMDDFFSHLDDGFDSLSTSLRWEDIMNHIRLLKPEAFCYCVGNELKEHADRTPNLKAKLEEYNIPLIVLGTDTNCSAFFKMAACSVDLTLRYPMRVSDVKDKLTKFLDDWYKEERARREAEAAQRAEAAERAIENAKAIEEELAQALMDIDKPKAKEATPEAATKTVPETATETTPETAPEQADADRRRHVLIVDDDSAMLKTIKEQLHEKYDVATALSGKIALKFLEKKKTDLILLDYEMPAEKGPDILKQLRANATTKDIPVIFLTGITEKEKITQVLAMRPQGYLVKPVQHDKLMEIIEKTLGV